ncbi:MAG: hypothetical protein NTX24_04680 [Candidatus Pacearchaeota archaeon]|nr:hypothetical protein [Candidatus Pacearchaeota archaeon]
MRSKRGQATLFIIIAIAVIAIVILAIIFIPKLTNQNISAVDSLIPDAYVSSCVKDVLEPFVEKISNQSGYLEQSNCIFYQGVCRRYLCYTSQYYAACVNQEPMLKEKIESVIKGELQRTNTVTRCVHGFVENARNKGYDINSCDASNFSVELIQGKISIPIDCKITMVKGEEKKTFEKVNSALDWPLYDFVMLSQEIIDEELNKKDFDPLSYMLGHYWVDIEKFRTSDDTKIFTLKERENPSHVFVFAVRGGVIPPGIM